MQPGALSGDNSAWMKIAGCCCDFCWLLYGRLAWGTETAQQQEACFCLNSAIWLLFFATFSSRLFKVMPSAHCPPGVTQLPPPARQHNAFLATFLPPGGGKGATQTVTPYCIEPWGPSWAHWHLV